MAKALDESMMITKLRTQEEVRLRVSKRDVAALSVKDVQRLVHELQVHQIELDMQNEELRRTQMELQASKEHFIELYDDSLVGQLTVDRQGTIVESNLNAAGLLGIARNELIGQSLAPFIAADHQDTIRRHYSSILETDTRHICEVQLCKETGASRWIYFKSRAVQDTSGRILQWRTALLDITDRKRASENLIENILGNVPSYIFATDRQHRFILVSDELVRFCGKLKEEVMGKTHHHVFPKHVADAIQATNEQIMVSGIPQQIEELVESLAGTAPRLMLTSKSPLRDEKGQTYGITGVATDITEHRKLEAQCRQLQKMEAIGRLAGGVAHDFNNLLTIIIGHSAMLLDQLPLEDPRRMMMEETLQASKRAATLTKQMLAFSRQQVFTKEPIDLNNSIQSIRAMIKSLLGETITLVTDLAPDLWSFTTDKGQCDQVLMNLAVNARDAMAGGGTLTIATRNLLVTAQGSDAYRMLQPGDYVHLSVCDTGCGMSPETLSHVFEPFFTTKEVGKGTGLGLATIYGIVLQSQGHIVADSQLGRGTTFDLYFPRVAAETAQVVLPTGYPLETGSETVLVVEDQDSVRALIVSTLMRAGYQVSAAASGAEALQLASSSSMPLHILLTDVVMPGMTGPALAEQLRRTWPNLRVLFTSGTLDHEKLTFLNELGTAFIQKPFLPQTLTRSLRDLLDNKSI